MIARNAPSNSEVVRAFYGIAEMAIVSILWQRTTKASTSRAPKYPSFWFPGLRGRCEILSLVCFWDGDLFIKAGSLPDSRLCRARKTNSQGLPCYKPC